MGDYLNCSTTCESGAVDLRYGRIDPAFISCDVDTPAFPAGLSSTEGPMKKKPTKSREQNIYGLWCALDRIEKAIKLQNRKGVILLAKIDDVLAKVAEVKAKVIALQQAKDAGGMTAAEEKQVDEALQDLSDTANPTIPNP